MPNDKKMTSIRNKAFLDYKEEFFDSLPIVLGFALISVPLLVLGAFWPISLLFSVPFIILPLFFSMSVSLCDGHKADELNNKVAIQYFFSYFRNPFYGTYRYVFNLGKSLFFSTIYAILASFILIPLFSMLDSSFYGELVSVYSSFSMSSFISHNEMNEMVLLYIDLLLSSSAAIFFLLLIFFLAKYTVSPFLRGRIFGAPSRLANEIYLGGIDNVKKAYGADCRDATLPISLSFVFVYIASFALSFLYLRPYLSPIGLAALPLAVSILFLSPFLSYYVYCMSYLFEKYSYAFLDYSMHLMERTLEEMATHLNDEEKKDIVRNIEKTKELRDDLNKDVSEDEESEENE